ncbi:MULTISPECIES: hypothetical protein [Clostridium]|nr:MULTISPECIES: hypothetical protein [Clostridium]MDU4548629.1 hypothetical protein [Clostridium botulinum]
MSVYFVWQAVAPVSVYMRVFCVLGTTVTMCGKNKINGYISS